VSNEKGNFSAEIGQDVIEAALKSVARAKGEEISVESPAAPTAEEAAPSAPEAPQETSAEAAEIESLKAQLELSLGKGREMMEKIKDSHERMLRAVADLDNFKKRAAKEKDEVQRFGVEKLLKDFLPVADNLDRALDHAKKSSDFDGLLKGLEMTRKLLEDTLGKHGVKGFTALGKAFDPRLHEAIQQQESADQPPNTVVNELVRGYTLHERLVRPALVVVAKPPAPAEPEGTPEAPPGDAA
jgi:molecular chaperone GrpE